MEANCWSTELLPSLQRLDHLLEAATLLLSLLFELDEFDLDAVLLSDF